MITKVGWVIIVNGIKALVWTGAAAISLAVVIYMEDMASRPNETFIYKVALTIGTLNLHCAIVAFHFERGFCGTPLCKLDVGFEIRGTR